MAVDELTPFLQLGPFLGIDNSTAEPYVAQGMSVYASNVNTYRNKNGMTPERGRVFLADFSAQFSQIDVLTYFILTALSRPALLLQGLDPSGLALATCVYDILPQTLTPISRSVKYTQAIQFGNAVYTNGGQRLFVDFLGSPSFSDQMFTWQYTGFKTLFIAPSGTYTITGAPATGQFNNYVIGGSQISTPQTTGNTLTQQAASDVFFLNQQNQGVFFASEGASVPGVVTITAGQFGNNATTTTGSSSGGDTLVANQATLTGPVLTSPTGGQIPEETRYYVTTQVAQMPDGTFSETSPENFPTPFSIVSGPGNTNSNTLTLANTLASPFVGFWPDNTPYTTNIYAQSSLQAGYFLVGNSVTNNPFVDTLSDAQLAQNTPLFVAGGSAFQRDPPPVGVTVVPAGENPSAGTLLINYAYLSVFNSCIFILTHIDTAIVAGSPVSTQLWYSQAGTGWEFSSDTRALLLQDMEENFLAGQFLITPSTQYQSLYGDYAKGLAVCGTVLVAWKHREMWLVYGTGSSIAPFQQISAFNVGAQSIRSITPAAGGAYVKTENGVYFFNGTTPQYNETNFVTVNANAPYSHSMADDSAAVGAFTHFSYILSYPTLGKSYVFNTLLNQWMSELPYAAASQDAVAYFPADPSLTAPGNPGLVSDAGMMCAVRAGAPTTVDYWFANDNNDLGTPTIARWEGPETDAPGIEFRKSYEMITVFAPKVPGTCTVKLSIDGRTPPYLASFDLSAQRPLIYALPRPSLGFSAKLSVELQGIPGEPAPQVWKVTVWGKNPPMEKLARPQ